MSRVSRFLDEVRIIKPGGRFLFSYNSSKNNDSFRDPGPSAGSTPAPWMAFRRISMDSITHLGLTDPITS